MRIRFLTVLVMTGLVSTFLTLTAPNRAAAATPQAVVDELLATDRSFSAASAGTDLVSGISAMFAAQTAIPLPGGSFARTRAEAVAALRENPENAVSRAEWTPVRGGVSADGQHGFTYGFMTIRTDGKPDKAAKYLSYWIRGADGWRVFAYRRAPRPDGEVAMALRAASLPAKSTAVSTDAERLAAQRRSLAAAEKAFSDEAQKIGIGPAFIKTGREDSMNLGGEADFTYGAAAIGGGFGNDKGSPVTWASEDTAVASSGDLGVSWGLIRPKEAATDRPAASAFFTVWRRDGPDQPWRYIAE